MLSRCSFKKKKGFIRSAGSEPAVPGIRTFPSLTCPWCKPRLGRETRALLRQCVEVRGAQTWSDRRQERRVFRVCCVGGMDCVRDSGIRRCHLDGIASIGCVMWSSAAAPSRSPPASRSALTKSTPPAPADHPDSSRATARPSQQSHQRSVL